MHWGAIENAELCVYYNFKIIQLGGYDIILGGGLDEDVQAHGF